jgi:hypothetical protein
MFEGEGIAFKRYGGALLKEAEDIRTPRSLSRIF